MVDPKRGTSGADTAIQCGGRHYMSRDCNHWSTLNRRNVVRVAIAFQHINGDMSEGSRSGGRHHGWWQSIRWQSIRRKSIGRELRRELRLESLVN
jgi:hypothetical protein